MTKKSPTNNLQPRMSIINGRIALGERTNLNDTCFSPSKGVKTTYAATIISAKSPAEVSLVKAGGSEAKIIDDASKEIEELAESIAAVRVEEDKEVELGSETEEEDPDFECSEEEESDEEYEDEDEEDEEDEDEEVEEDLEDAVPPPMTVAESSKRICQVFDELKNEVVTPRFAFYSCALQSPSSLCPHPMPITLFFHLSKRPSGMLHADLTSL